MNNRVLVFCTSYLPFIGGAQLAVHETIKRLPHVSFIILCPRLSRSVPRREILGKELVYRLGFGNNLDKYLFLFFGPLFARIKFGGKTTIWAIMANYGGIAALIFHYITFKRNRFILSLQEGLTLGDIKARSGLFFFLVERIVRSATKIHAISRYLAAVAQEIGADAKKCSVIPNGVDTSLFKPASQEERLTLRENFGLDPLHKILFTASRLSEKNCIDDIIHALTYLPNHYILLIAGDGEDAERLKKLVESKGLVKRVSFLGRLPIESIALYMKISDVFIRPSMREGLGSAFLEAMATGVPIVATAVGGINDFLVHGETGIAVEPRNIESIKSGIRAYEDIALYNRVRENGIKLVREKYTWDLIAVKVDELFRNREKDND